MSEVDFVNLLDEESGAFELEPEPLPEVTYRLVYTRPGSVVLDDGRSFVYNRPFETDADDAEFLLGLLRSGKSIFRLK